MRARHFLVALALPLLLVACAGNPSRTQRADDFRMAAGAPVKSFTFFNTLYSWEPLDDHTLVVYTRPKRAWLLEVGYCPDLSFTMSIGLTSSIGRVTAGFDKVVTARNVYPCYIQSIRPLDLARVHAAEVQRRKVKTLPRAQVAPHQQ